MIRVALLTVLALMSSVAVADQDHPEVDCAKIKNYAAAGDRAYKAGQYEKARDSYTDQVGWSETCELSEAAIATAYNNVALTWIRQGEYLKARAWLMIKKDDPKSQYNLNLIKDKLAALPAPAGPAGEFWQYAGRGMWSSYIISKKSGKYHLIFDGLYPGLMGMYNGPNMGSLEGDVIIANNKGVFHQQEEGSTDDFGQCEVSMNFGADTLTTSVKGDCGFGHNVSADGKYLRVK